MIVVMIATVAIVLWTLGLTIPFRRQIADWVDRRWGR